MPLGWNESRHYGEVVNLDLRSFRMEEEIVRIPAHGGVYI